MDSIVRGLVVYVFLLVVFRVSGKRTLSEATAFDLVLLLIISETTQQAMVGGDPSMTNAGLLILTLVGADIVLSVAKQRLPLLGSLLDGTPIVLVRDGHLRRESMDRERVDEDDLLEAARMHGQVAQLSEVQLAVLERGGRISVVPKGRSSC